MRAPTRVAFMVRTVLLHWCGFRPSICVRLVVKDSNVLSIEAKNVVYDVSYRVNQTICIINKAANLL